jgi:hypothetical protein
MNNIKAGLQLIGDFLVQKLREELEGQGHRDTGALIDSMKSTVKMGSTAFEIEIYAENYAKFMDTGFGKGKWVSVYALAEWVERKGIATGVKEIKSAAFAIRRKIFEEGSPTKGSYAFSSNGRRQNFINVVLDENASIIFEQVLEVFAEMTEITLTNTIKKNKQTFENTN